MRCAIAGDLVCVSMESSGTAVSPGHCGPQAYERRTDRPRALSPKSVGVGLLHVSEARVYVNGSPEWCPGLL